MKKKKKKTNNKIQSNNFTKENIVSNNTAKTSDLIGFDLGIKPKMPLQTDMTFPKDFLNAGFRGIEYITLPTNINDTKTQIKIALVFENVVNFKKAFDHLLYWSARSDNDGDAVALDFIDEKKGGYSLCIYPEIERFLNHALPQNLKDWVCPVYITPGFVQEIDQVSNSYQLFKDIIQTQKRSVILNAVGYSGSLRLVHDKEIILNHIRFFDEHNLPEDITLRGMYHQKDNFKKDNAELLLSRKEIDQVRVKNIQYFLPITFEKIKNKSYLSNLLEELAKEYSEIKAIQAICNLILKFRMEKAKIENKNEDKIIILNFLTLNPEDSESIFPDASFFSLEKIKEQITLDEKYLNDNNKRSQAKKLNFI